MQKMIKFLKIFKPTKSMGRSKEKASTTTKKTVKTQQWTVKWNWIFIKVPHERKCAQRRGGWQEQGRKIGFVFGVSIHFSILLLLFHLRCQLKPRMEKCKFNNAHFFLYLFFWWHDTNRPISVNLEIACKSLFEVSASEYVCVCVYNGCMASVFFWWIWIWMREHLAVTLSGRHAICCWWLAFAQKLLVDSKIYLNAVSWCAAHFKRDFWSFIF